MKLQENTAILIIREGKHYVLQHRDNIPTISDPGMFTAWGGKIEPEDLSPEAGAIRELEEETGIHVSPEELIELGHEIVAVQSPDGEQEILFYFFAIEIPADLSFGVYEGQGFVDVPSPFEGHPKVNDVTRQAIERYEAIV